MIKNSTLRAFIFSTILMGTTATITAGVCTNWFRGTSEKSSSSISSVIDSSLESSKSEFSSEESTSSGLESTSVDSSASSLIEETSSGSSSITSEETSSSIEESSSANEDPTANIHWDMGKVIFTGGNVVNNAYYQTKDFSIANLNETIIKSNYTYNGTATSKIGFAAKLNINFENEKFNFTQAQMDEINSLLTAKNLTLSEHQLSHITII